MEIIDCVFDQGGQLLNDEEKYSLHDKHTAKNRYLFEHAMQILPSTPEKDLQHGLDMTYGRMGKNSTWTLWWWLTE